MKVIPPIVLNHTNTSSDASGVIDPAEWDTSLSYSVYDRVRVTTGNVNKVYECIINTTASDASPEVDVLKITPKWVEIGSINEFAMFDTLRSTQTFADISLTVVLTPGQLVDSIAIMGLTNVLRVNISAVDSGMIERYNYTKNLNKRFTSSWYSYFFGRFISKAAFALFDLPTIYGNLTITLTFYGDVTFGVGTVVLGNALNIGNLQLGASVDVLNFSSIERDSFGSATLIPRRNVPKTRQVLFINKSRLNTIMSYRDLLDTVPAVWSGLDDDSTNNYYDAVLILGFYREFSFNINNPIGVYINLGLEEI